jgi:hypothetical protein
MTRPSKRELERELDDITDGERHPSGDRMLVHEDPETGDWYDDPGLTDGPLDKASSTPLMVLQETVVKTGYNE